MQHRPVFAQNVAPPYLLWPYVPMPQVIASPEVPVFHGQFTPSGLVPNELPSPFVSPQIYANNIIFQKYQQQQQQQQLAAKQINNAAFQNNNNNNNKQHQDQELSKVIKMETDFNANFPSFNPKLIDSVPQRRRPSTPNRNKHSSASAKKGLFTIDSILKTTRKDEEEDEEEEEENLKDEKCCMSPPPSPAFRRQHPEVDASPAALNWYNSPGEDLPSSRILGGTPPCGDANYRPGIPVFHSTPVSYHGTNPGATSPRRHSGPYLDPTHPYFPKHGMDLYQPHLYSSYQQHHQHLLAHASQQQHQQQQHSPLSRSSLNSSSLHSSASMSTTSSSPASSSTSSSTSSSSSKIDNSERKASNKNKRIRTIFTPDQLERLEAEFERQQYMVGTERFYLATSLHLTEAQVKVWFQNRRIKWRKQHLEQQQARLAQGDLYRDVDESCESELDDDVTEPMTSEASSQLDETFPESSARSDVD